MQKKLHQFLNPKGQKCCQNGVLYPVRRVCSADSWGGRSGENASVFGMKFRLNGEKFRFFAIILDYFKGF